MMSEDLPRKLPVVIAFSYEGGCEIGREREIERKVEVTRRAGVRQWCTWCSRYL